MVAQLPGQASMSNITRLELLREGLIVNHNPCKGVVIRGWWSYRRQYWNSSDWRE